MVFYHEKAKDSRNLQKLWGRISEYKGFREETVLKSSPKDTGDWKVRGSLLRAGFTRLLDLPNRQQRGKDAGQRGQHVPRL